MTSRQRSKAEQLRLGLLAALIATALFSGVLAAVGEVGLRYRERHRTTVPGTMPMLFYQHRRLGHALVRGYDYYGWIHVNRHGFRGDPVSEEKPADVFRIMVVGASTTFDMAVESDDHTWPARLEARLSELQPEREFEVINAGVPGYRVLDNLIRLQIELYRFEPDLLILYHAHNDLIGALGRARRPAPEFAARPDEIPTVTLWGRWLSQHSMLYTKLAARWRVIRFHAGGGEGSGEGPLTAMPGGIAEQFRRDLTSFVRVAQGLGIRVVMSGIVQISGGRGTAQEPDIREMWARAVPFATPDVVVATYGRFNDVIRSVATENSIPHVPTDGFGLVGTCCYAPGDPIHFNDAGAERMAAGMAEALVAGGIIAPAPRESTRPPG